MNKREVSVEKPPQCNKLQARNKFVNKKKVGAEMPLQCKSAWPCLAFMLVTITGFTIPGFWLRT